MANATLDTYNRSAAQLAEYFKGIGPRVDDVDHAIALWGGGTPDVIELGCGDGRDAEVITKRAGTYTGVDYSEELIQLAQARKLKAAHFLVGDLTELAYQDYPRPDIIFAFASLLHLSIEQNQRLLQDGHRALRAGGIVYLSLKYADSYCSRVQTDQYGERLFYYYHPDEIVTAAGDGYDEVYRDFQSIGSTRWFTLGLKKDIDD